MPVRAIVYTSRVSRRIDATALDLLVSDAAAFNGIAAISGVLLFDGGRFLQYLEGPDEAVSVCYERICQATTHCEMVELSRDLLGIRRFPRWPMREFQVDPIVLGSIALAEWAGFARRRPSGGMPSGVDRLMDVVDDYDAS